jgi:hypothetical protein
MDARHAGRFAAADRTIVGSFTFLDPAELPNPNRGQGNVETARMPNDEESPTR